MAAEAAEAVPPAVTARTDVLFLDKETLGASRRAPAPCQAPRGPKRRVLVIPHAKALRKIDFGRTIFSETVEKDQGYEYTAFLLL